MDTGNNKLKTYDESVVWVDLETNYQKDDVVRIDVIAEAAALAGTKYEFTASRIYSNNAIKN